MSINVKLSRVERLLNAAGRVPIIPKPDDPYLAKVLAILAEERAEGYAQGAEAGAPRPDLCESCGVEVSDHPVMWPTDGGPVDRKNEGRVLCRTPLSRAAYKWSTAMGDGRCPCCDTPGAITLTRCEKCAAPPAEPYDPSRAPHRFCPGCKAMFGLYDYHRCPGYTFYPRPAPSQIPPEKEEP